MSNKIVVNLTQHTATQEQVAAGVIDLGPEFQNRVRELLTFDELPSHREVWARANELVSLLLSRVYPSEIDYVMIGGAPFLMHPLVTVLYDYEFVPVFAFSRRVTVEEKQSDGSVIKKSIFKHEGFVEVGESF